jgi:drug/metabolite transporter (DMT)-like permease
MRQSLTVAAAAEALLVSFLWGGNVAALKLGLDTFAPFWSAFWRMALAFAVLAAWAKWQGMALGVGARDRRNLAILGVLFAAQIALLNLGTKYTSPAYAVVLVNANPLFANLIGHFLPLEPRLTPARLLGLAVAMTGVCWVMLGEPVASLAPEPMLGNVMTTVSAGLLGIRLLYTRHLVQSIPPLRAIVWQVGLSAPLFLVAAAALEPPVLGQVAWPAVAAIVYQGVVVAGFCFVVWASLLRNYSAGTISMFSFTIPFFGMAASALLFGEPVTGRLIAGAAMVTIGIVIVSRV